MNRGAHIICTVLFIALLTPGAQAQEVNAQETTTQETETNVQDSELREAMRRWLREQNELTTPDFRIPQQPSLTFPPLQQRPQQEMLRVLPTAHFPNYLIQAPTTDCWYEWYEELLLSNMRRSLDMNFYVAPTIDRPIIDPVLDIIGHIIAPVRGDFLRGEVFIFGREFAVGREARLRKLSRERTRRALPEERLPTRFDIRCMNEINDRVNQFRRAIKEEKEKEDWKLEDFDN